MAVRLSTVPALDPFRALGHFAGGAERKRGGSGQCSDDRQHGRSGPSSCRRRKRGTQKEGLGRSKGGFTSKIHLRANIRGLPVASTISAGQVSDFKGYHPVMEDGGPEPKVLIADRGHDADFIREDMEERGGVAVIPTKRNRKI